MTILTNDIHRNVVAKQDEPQTYRCDKCNKGFRMSTHLKIHSCVPDISYRCHVCNDQVYHSVDDLNEHLKIHATELFGDTSSNVLENQCDICGKIFNKKIILKRHKILHTSDKSFACTTCGKLFTTNGFLERHIKTHTRELPTFTCKDCGKNYIKEHMFKAHVLTHTEKTKESHDCLDCGKSFANKKNLTKHARIHTK